jgi:tRNA A-37 threonylcarbamoyl transferase component Bud32
MDVGERYVLGRLIGEGATARVFEAEDRERQREVAVKVFRDPDVGDVTSERIDEEARILAALDHPHLLRVYDSGLSPDGRRFIVMPLVRGTTLGRLLARGPVPPREVKRIGTALAEALAHIHARGVVHRDVKPSNVLLAEDGTPYLADFGFARAADGPALTATDCIVGTAGYLAPEQAEGLPVTPAVDVYALGLVLLEALTGERAYQGTPLERATANALRPPRIPAALGTGWLKALLAMTSRAPAERPTAAEVTELLGLAEDDLPEVSASDGTMVMPMPAHWSRVMAATGTAGDSASGHSAASSSAQGIVAADGPRVRRRGRLAAAGAAAAAAVAVLGVGANMLSAGASADTHVPVPMTPGAGAAATPPPSATTVTVSPSTTPAPATVATTVYKPLEPAAPAARTTQPGPGQQPGQQPGKCHDKHKCQGGAGGGGDHGGEDH